MASDKTEDLGSSKSYSVRFSPDFGAKDPLWPRNMEARSVIHSHISNELMSRLEMWQAVFEENYRPRSGWSSEQVKDQWRREAIELERDLRKELPETVELTIDLWPLD